MAVGYMCSQTIMFTPAIDIYVEFLWFNVLIATYVLADKFRAGISVRETWASEMCE